MWKKKTTDLKKKSPNLKNKLDTVFSRFIRLRDARKDGTFQCISCGRILPLDQADCGHYINRQHMSTRFSEKNCNAQCRSCNRFDEGNMQGYDVLCALGLISAPSPQTDTGSRWFL